MVPIAVGEAPVDGVVVGEAPVEGEVVGVPASVLSFDGHSDASLDNAVQLDDSRPFCIACPTKPPIRPAIKATRSPINARIHHRFHP